jgi:hypothetical protein
LGLLGLERNDRRALVAPSKQPPELLNTAHGAAAIAFANSLFVRLFRHLIPSYNDAGWGYFPYTRSARAPQPAKNPKPKHPRENIQRNVPQA